MPCGVSFFCFPAAAYPAQLRGGSQLHGGRSSTQLALLTRTLAQPSPQPGAGLASRWASGR
eukprot:2867110-Rhodomonas_salina.2